MAIMLVIMASSQLLARLCYLYLKLKCSLVFALFFALPEVTYIHAVPALTKAVVDVHNCSLGKLKTRVMKSRVGPTRADPE